MTDTHEKFMEQAWAISEEIGIDTHPNKDAKTIALALSQAHQDGIRKERERCSRLLAAVVAPFKRAGKESDWTDLLDLLSAAIDAGGAE